MNVRMLANQHHLLGSRLPRRDGVAKVTGLHTYASDVILPGTLYGKVLRSPFAHARILGIDTSGALEIPGVRTVITAADIGRVHYGVAVKDMTVFALDRALYIGHPIAAVAATSTEIAEKALEAIKVEYDVMEPVCDPEAAMSEGAAIFHVGWESYEALPYLLREGNIASRSRIEYGDVDLSFRQAHRIYENRFTTPLVHAGYTEPRVATASWDGNAVLTVWSNSQLPFEVRSTLAEILEVPVSSVRIVVPGIGGGFGGKLRIGMEHFAALLARKSGRPVKISSTTEEEFAAAHPRQASIIDIRTAFTRDGGILAREGRIILDCGAAAGSGPGTAATAMQILAGPYKIPNLKIESLAVYTNKVPTGSFRAPPGPMANFAVESQMDIAADDLGIDPLQLRLRNIVQNGDLGPTGQVLKGVSLEECLLRAAEAIGWQEGEQVPGRGKAVACGWWFTAGGSSGVQIKLSEDGKVSVLSGAVEIGTGAMTGVAQILAEQLSLDLEDIQIATVDTQTSPYDYGAQGSRTMCAVGNACLAAAEDLRAQIFATAANHFGIPPEEMFLRDKAVVARDKRLSLANVARISQATGGGLIASGAAISRFPAYDSSRVKNHPLPVWNGMSFHAHAADVSVDRGTGEVTIHRYVVAQDVGYAINPTYVEGQIEGGVVQGIGQALFEEIICENGRVLNGSLTDYKMPTSLDVPPILSILVEYASENGPYGAKGVGEPPLIEPPATLANAIAVATGMRFCRLPITAETILREQQANKDQSLCTVSSDLPKRGDC